MIWWYWMLVGLVLLGVEMVTPGGFYILFFGLAASGRGHCWPEWGSSRQNGSSGCCFRESQSSHCSSFADHCWPGSKPVIRKCRPWTRWWARTAMPLEDSSAEWHR